MGKITVAKNAGYCYGVRRAIEKAESLGGKGRKVYTAGPLIHNKFVVEQLEGKGIFSREDIESIPDGAAVVVRAHGITLEKQQRLMEKGCRLEDATCPHVGRIHRIVEEESGKGRHILLIGAGKHPEVLGIASRCKSCTILENEAQAREWAEKNSQIAVSVVSQTTFNREIFVNCTKILKNACKSINIFDTICNATDERQKEARTLASGSDLVIVIGDQTSSNSRRLYEICLQACPDTLFVENVQGIPQGHCRGKQAIAIAAGASTPDLIIKEVYDKMTDEMNIQETESFAELLEQTLKTLHTGEKVTGVITQINPTDIHVDLGVKQAGYIPTTELSDDPNYVIADNIHIGDEIEAYVMRVNDQEGTIMLSKKRLDAVKNWEVLEKAVETGEVYDCVITDVNKGGVIANVLGIRVFIPASQTGLPREADLSQMVKTHQKVRITEVTRPRRRVVGSIKAPLMEARREAAAKIWEEIEVGSVYTGTVKSFTSYGAFVDIGGVDGMIHISELSWSRVKHPSDVLKIGQTVEVYVIALDKEKKKISLGYKKAEDNPWTKFESNYNVGDVAPVKIVKFMPFGAFAEVLPGVDGLIHISQIADRRIGKPEEVLTIGETVNAKITDIDSEKKKISLSIRALLDDSNNQPEEVEAEETDAE